MRNVLRIIIPLLLALTLALFCCGCKEEGVLHAGDSLLSEVIPSSVVSLTCPLFSMAGSSFVSASAFSSSSTESSVSVFSVTPPSSCVSAAFCIVTISEKEDLIIYVKYGTGDVTQLSLADLQPGDDVILWIYDSELSKAESGSIAKLYEIQLGTQRLS